MPKKNLKQFAVTADSDTVEQWKKFIADNTKPGETQSDTLKRIFNSSADKMNTDALTDAGASDELIKNIETSIQNIRNAFSSCISHSNELLKKKDADYSKIRDLKEQIESELRTQIKTLSIERDQAVESAANSKKIVKQMEDELESVKKQTETSAQLVAEKDKSIISLTDRLRISEEKAKSYDDLLEQKKSSDNKIRDLEIKIKESEIEKTHAVSDAKKDAELSKQQAVSDAVRAADKENAKLTARIEILEEQIADLRSQLQQYNA